MLHVLCTLLLQAASVTESHWKTTAVSSSVIHRTYIELSLWILFWFWCCWWSDAFSDVLTNLILSFSDVVADPNLFLYFNHIDQYFLFSCCCWSDSCLFWCCSRSPNFLFWCWQMFLHIVKVNKYLINKRRRIF